MMRGVVVGFAAGLGLCALVVAGCSQQSGTGEEAATAAPEASQAEATPEVASGEGLAEQAPAAEAPAEQAPAAGEPEAEEEKTEGDS